MSDDRLCILPHPEQPRRALDIALICRKHERAILEDLTDLATLYALLDDVIEPGSVVADELVRYAKRPDPAAPMRLEIAVLRDTRTTWDLSDPDSLSVLETLTGWATIVREEMRLSVGGRATVISEVGVLRVQHDFVIAQAWVDDYAKDIHRAATAVRHACGEYDRAADVGSCPVVHQVDDVIRDGEIVPGRAKVCGGRLFPDRYGLMRVRCSRCGEVWDEDELRRLGLVLES